MRRLKRIKTLHLWIDIKDLMRKPGNQPNKNTKKSTRVGFQALRYDQNNVLNYIYTLNKSSKPSFRFLGFNTTQKRTIIHALRKSRFLETHWSYKYVLRFEGCFKGWSFAVQRQLGTNAQPKGSRLCRPIRVVLGACGANNRPL